MADHEWDPMRLWFEVNQALTRYTRALDAGRIEDVVEMFTPDGVFSAAIGGEVRGQAALREYYSKQLTEPEWAWAMAGRGATHMVTNLSVEQLPGGARAFSDFIYVLPSGDHACTVAFVGSYEDDLINTSQGWRFARRRTLERKADLA